MLNKHAMKFNSIIYEEPPELCFKDDEDERKKCN